VQISPTFPTSSRYLYGVKLSLWSDLIYNTDNQNTNNRSQVNNTTNNIMQQKFFISLTSKISTKTTARYAYFAFTT